MGLDPPGPPVAAQRLRLWITLFALKLAPAADAGRANPEPLACLAVRQTACDSGKHPNPKIHRQSFRHVCRPPPGRKSESDFN